MADPSIPQFIRELSGTLHADSGNEQTLKKYSPDVASESITDAVNSMFPSDTNNRGPVAGDIDGTTTDLCANCGGPGSSLCTGCADGIDMHGDISTTLYCSNDCQREHWAAAHKAQCRLSIDRRQLYRIGALLQWAFYGARKTVWYDEITRVEQDGQDDDAKLLVWHAQKQDPSRFSAFPHEVLDDERDKRAVLAGMAAGTPGVAMVSGLLLELLKVSNTKIQIHEVAVRPRACRFVRFVPQVPVGSDDPSICWLFRATLRDGSAFAIDHECGIFPWAQYLQRLSLPDPSLLDFQTLDSGLKRLRITPITGNKKDVEAGIVTEADMRLTANIMATTNHTITATMLPIKQDGMTLAKLMQLPSAGYEHALALFKTQHGQILDGARDLLDMGNYADYLLQRLEVGAWQGP